MKNTPKTRAAAIRAGKPLVRIPPPPSKRWRAFMLPGSPAQKERT